MKALRRMAIGAGLGLLGGTVCALSFSDACRLTLKQCIVGVAVWGLVFSIIALVFKNGVKAIQETFNDFLNIWSRWR